MNRASWPCLLAALALAGCAAVPDGVGGLRERHVAPEPYVRQYHDTVAVDYNRTYAYPVDVGATLVNVTVALAVRSGGVVPANTAPAFLDVLLLDAAGGTLNGVRLDAQQPNATLKLAPHGTGPFFVQLSGHGASVAGQGAEVSTTYALSIEVDYG